MDVVSVVNSLGSVIQYIFNGIEMVVAFIGFLLLELPLFLFNIFQYLPQEFVVIITGAITLFFAFIVLKLIKMLPLM